MSNKQPVNMRLPGPLVEALDRYAADRGMTRTSAVEAIVTDAIQAAEKPSEATEKAEAPNTQQPDQTAVIAVLRDSNADLRRHASELYAMIATKDRQIEALQVIVNQSQQIEMGRIATSSKGGAVGLRERIRRLFSGEGRRLQ